MIQKSLGSTSVIRHNYNKACVQAFYQQHENHLSTRSEQGCFQACRRYMWRSGYLYKVSILWSNYWHWENLVIRNEWVFFVCKQIAFWFIRDAPLRTNCSRCCLCSQWLKGPTWISYERVAIAFNPVLYWTRMLLAGAAARLEEHRAWGAAHQLHNHLLDVPSQCWVQEGLQLLPPRTGLATFLGCSRALLPIAPTRWTLQYYKLWICRPPSRIFHQKIVMEVAYSDDRNPCCKYLGSGKPLFPAMCTHVHGD